MTGDVYGAPPHVGRGGWTWYTGSAGWLYRVGLEALLGFQVRGCRLRIDPCIPFEWQEFRLTYRRGDTTYEVEVHNPDAVERGVRVILLDGVRVDGIEFELPDDGRPHRIRVEMGSGL
jgi:cyclic beta-1,2-glucan synthetase